MKRRRSGRTNKSVCPFEACGQTFSSAALLASHETAHNADKPLKCGVKGCSIRFATVADREAHVRATHVKRRSTRRRQAADDSLLAVGDEPVVMSQETVVDMQERGGEKEDKEAESEAQEIAENAEYLASQMRIARSYGIAKWGREDYHNAHQWAVWVQDGVSDFTDIPMLSRILKKKNLSVRALRNAERAFFDSALGFEGLSTEIMQHLVSAVAEKDDAEEEEKERKREGMDSLVAAIAAATERKRELNALNEILADISNVLPAVSTIAKNPAPPPTRVDKRPDIAAKADVLLRRHARLTSNQIRQHLKQIGEISDDEMFEILAREAKVAYDASTGNCHEVMRNEASRLLFSFLRTEFAKNMEKMIWRLEDGLLIDLCECDFQLFDSYLSYLLKRHQEIASHPEDPIMKLLRNGSVSLRQVAEDRLRKGQLLELDLEEVGLRIRALATRTG